MLLIVYRSILTSLLTLVAVAIEVAAARGWSPCSGISASFRLSTHATNLLTLLAVAAGTDYAIFPAGPLPGSPPGRRGPMAAYFTMYRSTAHVIIGSGLTVAAAIFCLRFTKTPYFQSLGIPAGIGVLVTLVASPSPWRPRSSRWAAPSGCSTPKRAMRTRGWRRIGTAGGPLARADPGGLDRGRTDRTARPAGLQDLLRRPPVPAGLGAGQGRLRRRRTAFLHRPAQSRGADGRIRQDLRTPANMKVLENVAKAVPHAGRGHGAVHHPAAGHPADHTSLGFAMSAQSSAQLQSLPFQQARAADLARQVAEISKAIDPLRQQYGLQ